MTTKMVCIKKNILLKLVKTLVNFIILISTLDIHVLTTEPRHLQQSHFESTSTKIPKLLSLNNKSQIERVLFKTDEFTNKSSYPYIVFTQSRLKRLNKRSLHLEDLTHETFLFTDFISSCLTAEQTNSFRTANKINAYFSLFYLIKTLDLNSQTNISKTCSVNFSHKNSLLDLIKPLFTHNTTHLQRLSSLVSQLLTTISEIDNNLLNTLVSSFKSSISSEYKSLKIVVKNSGKLQDALEDSSMMHSDNKSDKELYKIHEQILKDSKDLLPMLCNEGSLGPQLPLFWGNVTYEGFSNSWVFVVSVAVVGCDDQKHTFLRGFIRYEFTLDMLNTDPCSSTHAPPIFHHKCPSNLQCITKNDRRNSSIPPYQCVCGEGLCVKTYTGESWIESNEIESQYIDSVFNTYTNYNKNNKQNDYNNHNNQSYKTSESQIDFSILYLNYTCVPCKNNHTHYRNLRSHDDYTNHIDHTDHTNHTSHTNHTCDTSFNVLLRGIPLAIEALSMTICVALLFAVFQHRKTKMIKVSIWLLLETLVVGCLLIHIAVVVRYFEATTSLCIMIPWFREVGFTVVYGSLILKVYKVLAEFQSRKAHRAQVRDKDLLRGLLVMVVVVVGYMAAWTAVTIDSEAGHNSHNYTSYNQNNTNNNIHQFEIDNYHNNDNKNHNFNHNYISDKNISSYNHTNACGTHHNHHEWSVVRWNRVGDSVFTLCRCAWWDVVIEIVEILFLSWGLRLCYRARTAPSIHHEVSSITIVIANELVISLLFHIIRYWLWLRVHSDYLYLMFFIRAQLTTSPLLLVILAPKLWYINKGIEDGSLRLRGLSSSDGPDNQESVKLNTTSYGEVDVSEIRIEDMSPDDIRSELKRVYTQLEIYKTKSLRQDNPHISRKKGGKKQAHRRFSLQTFHNRHKRQPTSSEATTADAEASKTPEESTNSAERGSVCMEDGEVGNRKGSFKRGHSKTKV